MYALSNIQDSGAGFLAGLGAAFVIWLIISLAFIIWNMWALGRLFSQLGLPAVWGWIPIWNQWQLLARAGLPGWFVIVPFLNAAVPIMTIVAIHRLNTEFGRGGGLTAVGVFLPPVWAMLLANHISDQGAGQGSHWPAGSPMENVAQTPGQGYTPEWSASPSMSPAFAEAGVGFGASDHGQASQYQGLPPVPGVATAASTAGPPPFTEGGQGFAPAPSPVASVPPGPPSPPQGQEDPFSAMGFGTPAPPGAQAPGLPAVPPVPAPPGAPGSAPNTAGNWGFGNTTEGEFERLAAEQLPPRPGGPLGPQEVQRPYSWPEMAPGSTPSEAASLAPAPPAPSAPLPPAPLPPVPEQSLQAPPQPPESMDTAGPSIFDVPQPAAPSPFEPAPAVVPPAPPAPAPAPSGSVNSQVEPDVAVDDETIVGGAKLSDDEEDRTVVFSRRSRWVLELPNGEVVDLPGDDLILGRKPEALPGTTAVKIADPTRTMSKSHLRMRREGDTWTVEDLNSTNGVAVIDEAGESIDIAAGAAAEVTERLVIGTLEVLLRRAE